MCIINYFRFEFKNILTGKAIILFRTIKLFKILKLEKLDIFIIKETLT